MMDWFPEDRCSTCLHAVQKKKYKHTVPSIHTCLNEDSERYLKDNVWTDTCIAWEADID